jgi:hypothetical protein
MTLLDEIIDGSTDSSVAVSDLLRKVQIVATRVGATDLVAWVKQELQGYTGGDLPPYRRQRTSVKGLFTGPMQSQVRQDLPHHPDLDEWFTVEMSQPLMELEAFANGDSDPSREWNISAVKQYERTGRYSISYHVLFSASNTITRQSLRGIIDTVRTKAMEFALELQEQSPDAGSQGGPTINSDSAMAQVVYNITNNITGHGTNIAAGTDIHQQSKVKQSDVDSLRSHAEGLGLSSDDAQEFASALQEEQSLDGTRVQAVLSRVRAGTVDLTSKVSASVIAGALLEAGKQFLGIS